jgi:putative ABC transport system permease protein
MLRNYLKYAIRNFKSNRLIFAGSIVIVFLSTLCITLLYSYLHNELTMDGFHNRVKNIFMFTVKESPEMNPISLSPKDFFNFNFKEYPEIEDATSIIKLNKGNVILTYGDLSYTSEGIATDSSFFKIFNFNLIIGNKKSILQDKDAAILTEEFARKLFGKEDPINKVIEIKTGEQKNYIVKGIVASPPSNSSLTFNFIIPEASTDFNITSSYFILVNDQFNVAAFTKKVADIGNFHPQFKNGKTDIIPLKAIYYNDNIMNLPSFFSRHGSIKTNYILFVIICVIFLISMLNFSNLQIVNINDSLKKIGIQKTLGAERKHILYQKLCELLIIILLSAILVTFAFITVLPLFNKLTGTGLTANVLYVFLSSCTVSILLLGSAIIYPSTIISKISVSENLKNQLFTNDNLTGRNIISTVQFTLSVILLIASFVVTKQLNFMLKKDIGFTSDNIMCTQIFHKPKFNGNMEEYNKEKVKLNEEYQYVVNELKSSSTVKKFSQGISPITSGLSGWQRHKSGSDYVSVNMLQVTPGYQEVLGLKLTEGRFFEKGRKDDKTKVVINEAAKKFFGIQNIATDRLRTQTWRAPQTDGIEIIGVVKDFNFENLSVKPQPLVMIYSSSEMTASFLIQFQDKTTQGGIQFVRQLFKNVNPRETFTYTFLADDIRAMYTKEEILGKIYTLFTFIAYIISVIGLFTISLYETKKRTKEIGIRKVNGAKISEMVAMLNKDFLKWVMIAFFIATPVAWYAMHKWLEDFAYKTTLSWWIFVLAGLLTLGIALLTISWQSWRAATRNPVEALRYE